MEWNGGGSPGRRLAEILFGSQDADPQAQLARVRHEVDRLETLVRGLEQPDEAARGHVIFFRSEGAYAVRAVDGPCPQPGERVEGQVVLRVGPSPLPGDRRPCAFLEPLEP